MRKSHATSLTPKSSRMRTSTVRSRMRCGSGVDSLSSNGVWFVRHEYRTTPIDHASTRLP